MAALIAPVQHAHSRMQSSRATASPVPSVGGSVKRVAEEVAEWGDPVPEHAQHLRVLVHCVSLEPSQYRECYRARRRRRGETGFCARGQIREDTLG